MSSSLGHAPAGERWEFDTSVTTVFDDMLKRSIPQYEVMRHAVTELALRYVKPGTDVLDLGCSLGEALALSPTASAAAVATWGWKYPGPCWRERAVASSP